MQDEEGGEERQDEDHRPVCVAGDGVAVETYVDSREEGAED